MKGIKSVWKYIRHPGKIILRFTDTKRMSDEKYLKLLFRDRMGYKLNLEQPKTYSEKLQWLKLYDRRPEYTQMVDKYEAKLYVADRIGEEYIIPTLGVWEKFDDIDFDGLPDQFVLKCTHDSGGLIVCRDKSKLDKEAARKKIERCLKRNYYWHNREWAYKDVKPRIIAEKLITEFDDPEGLVEYKIFCFNGKPKMVLVCKGQAHGAGRTNDFCDLELKRYPFTSLNPNSKGELKKPEELGELLRIAEVLAKDTYQLRVDTYLANKKIYFGELTFFHNGGLATFDPPEWDEKLGEWITLPEKTEE